MRKVIAVASIAAEIQFGWALQLSLLTPYVQLLGIPHKWASLIWLCSPVSGLLVQPIVGYYSDRCMSSLGRRRPFIAAGAASVAIAVVLIGFTADMGHHFGNSLDKTPKTRAIIIFTVGFWILDVANNMLLGPCRAFLADLSWKNASKMRAANAFFSFFMTVGNILGYAAGSHTHLHKIFPFTTTVACDVYCTNLKSCFFLSIILLIVVTVVALTYVQDKQWSPEEAAETEHEKSAARTQGFGEFIVAFKELKRPMWMLLIMTCLNWIAWFPFLLFDTDWMGREVYGGDSAGGDADTKMYNMGVRAGSLGLMLNSIVLVVMSLAVERLGRQVGGVKRLWGIVNYILAVCLALTVLITKLAESYRQAAGFLPPPLGIKAGTLALFSVLGIPLAITYSIPFALASILSARSRAGQGNYCLKSLQHL